MGPGKLCQVVGDRLRSRSEGVRRIEAFRVAGPASVAAARPYAEIG